MSILGRFAARGGLGGMETRTLTSSAFVPPPSVGILDDYVGIHRAMSNLTVLACVRILADTIATLPWKAYRRDKNGIPVELNPQPALLKTPFPGFDLFQYKWMLVSSLALRGNFFGVVTSRDSSMRPTAILPLHPDSVFLERRPDLLMWFDPIYRVLGEQIPSEDIVHIRRFTMAGEPYGLSPVRQAAVAIGLGLAAEEYGYRYFKESATPSGILSTDQDLGDEAVTRQQKNWIGSHGGRRMPAVLTGGFKWQTVGIAPNECVAAGTLLTMKDGSRKPVEDITLGEEVMSWDGSKLSSARVVGMGQPPIKPMVKITTVRGRELVCTNDHPMLALRQLSYPHKDPGWINAGDLKPGQHVQVALGHVAEGDFPTDVAYFLGAMVADGNIRPGGARWYKEDPAVVAKMQDIVKGLGGHLAPEGARNYGVRLGSRSGSGATSMIKAILAEAGLYGTFSHDKFVPEMIMQGGPEAWRGFLAGYCDGDGFVTDQKSATPRVTFNSTSKELLYGVQHLLALLGVNASVTYKPSAGGRRAFPDGVRECREQWTLNVTGIRQVQRLAEEVTLTHSLKAPRLQDHLDASPKTLRRSTTDNFDRVKTVEHLGDGVSYGVTIEGHHTHVTDGLVTHNSQFLQTRAYQKGEISMLYGIPPHMIGDTEKSTSWGSGIEQLNIGALTYTFRAWSAPIESMISSMLPAGQYVRFDYRALLRGDIKTRYDAYDKALHDGWLNVNEVRSEEEMEPIGPDGDIYLQPVNYAPLGYAPTSPSGPGNPGGGSGGGSGIKPMAGGEHDDPVSHALRHSMGYDDPIADQLIRKYGLSFPVPNGRPVGATS